MADAFDPSHLPARLDALEAAVRARSALVPRLGIVLGSGLGGLAELLEAPVAIPFAELPGWPSASAPGHAGRLLLGKLEGVPVACLQGRLHLYEGHLGASRGRARAAHGPARSDDAAAHQCRRAASTRPSRRAR